MRNNAGSDKADSRNGGRVRAGRTRPFPPGSVRRRSSFFLLAFVLFVFQSFEYGAVAAAPVFVALVHAADGRGTCPGRLADRPVALALVEQSGDRQALGEIERLLDCGDVVEESVDFLACFQAQQRVAEQIGALVVPMGHRFPPRFRGSAV